MRGHAAARGGGRGRGGLAVACAAFLAVAAAAAAGECRWNGGTGLVMPPPPSPRRPPALPGLARRCSLRAGSGTGAVSVAAAGAELVRHRRWALAAFLAVVAPIVLVASARAEPLGRKVVDKVSYSQQEDAGLAAQSNKDVAKYADFGDGLRVARLDVPKYAEGDPAASRQVQRGDRVTVDLIGYLSGWNGVIFVRTQDKSGFSESPVTFTVGAGEAIPGLDRGVVGMVKGEKRRVVIPGSLGYPRPLREEDLGKPGAIPDPRASSPGSGAAWELRNRLLNGVVNNSSRDDTLVMDVKVVRIAG